MPNSDRLLELAKQYYAEETGSALSEVLEYLLGETLSTGGKLKSYSQIGAEIGYSVGYLKNVASRELWAVFSEILGTKVTRQNIRALLVEQVKSSEGRTETTAENMGTQSTNDIESVEQSNSSVPWILIVDDQPNNIKFLMDLLQNEEYQVWTATNGTEGLKKAGMLLPDLIVLDVNMPGMNGYEVCRQLKANAQTRLIPVIFISALNETWDKVQGFSVGATDYITKPLNTIETLVRIDHQLELRTAEMEVSSLGGQTKEDPLAQPVTTLHEGAVDKLSDVKPVIMVVDDEPKNLLFLADVLKDDGYRVWQSKTGAETLKFAPKIVPDLILLDICLPDMSGYDVCGELRAKAQTKRIPVIFVSGLDATWDKVKGFAVGGNDYVTKPVKVLELHCRIKNQLRLQQLRRKLMGREPLKTES